jgi:hydroxymethylpyrimidine/phosphomethylpyrimidine kinase
MGKQKITLVDFSNSPELKAHSIRSKAVARALDVSAEKLPYSRIKIGIAPQAKIRERVLAIAKGELKPKASDPKIWFTSVQSLLDVLLRRR